MIIEYFTPSTWSREDHADGRRRARVLIAVSFVLVPVLALRGVGHFLENNLFLAFNALFVCLGTLVVLGLVKRGGHLKLAVNLECTVLFLGGLALAASRGPNFSSPLLAMCGIVFLAMFAGSRFQAYFWAGLHGCAILGFGIFHSFWPSGLDSLSLASRPVLETIGALGCLVAMVLLTLAYDRSRLEEIGSREIAEYEKTRAKSEAALLRVDRYLVLGQLTSNVTHEVNNPLQILSGNLEELKRARETGAYETAEISEILSDMGHAMESIRHLMDDLREYTQDSDQDSDSAELGELIDAALHMAGARLRRVASVERDLSDERLIVELPRAPIQQIILNLLLNAADAIGEQGTERGRIRVSAHKLNDFWVRVVVHDDGVGMSEVVQRRALEPFFSTKEKAGGGGIGLAACKAILEGLGGRFYMESEPNKGTRVTVDLPMVKGEEFAKPPVRCVELSRMSRLRILLVDDDVVVGRTIKLVLHDHDVIFAHGGKAALAILQEDAGFDAILLDVCMPEMDGMETYAQILDVRPRLAARVILVTGGANNRRLQEFLQSTELPLLTKPVDGAACARALKLVATGRPESGSYPIGRAS